MSLIWIFILFLQIIYSAEAVDPNEPLFVSVDSGKTATLSCKVENAGQSSKIWVWYRQRAGEEPQEVAVQIVNKEPTINLDRFEVKEQFSLIIKNATKDDEGMYFCGTMEKSTLKFSNGTSFLAVKGHPQLNISVIQTPVSASVPPGQPVNLQCSVYPENQSAELRVFWFRSAAGSSSPEIIHTHNFSRSSRQCVYNFSKIITDENDTGTFYCAVATCGRIIVGSGTPVNLKGPVDPTVIILGAAVGVCVVVIIAQSIVFYKRRNSEQSSGRSTNSEQPWSAVQNSANQDGESAGVNYASVQFKDRKDKAGRVKREQSEDVVYSDVRRHAAANNRSHR